MAKEPNGRAASAPPGAPVVVAQATLRHAAPEAPISVIREEAVHVSPGDFLRGGVLEPKPFRADARSARMP